MLTSKLIRLKLKTAPLCCVLEFNMFYKHFSYLFVLRIQDIVQPLVQVAIRGQADIVSHRSTTQHCRHGLENEKIHVLIRIMYFLQNEFLLCDLIYAFASTFNAQY